MIAYNMVDMRFHKILHHNFHQFLFLPHNDLRPEKLYIRQSSVKEFEDIKGDNFEFFD